MVVEVSQLSPTTNDSSQHVFTFGESKFLFTVDGDHTSNGPEAFSSFGSENAIGESRCNASGFSYSEDIHHDVTYDDDEEFGEDYSYTSEDELYQNEFTDDEYDEQDVHNLHSLSNNSCTTTRMENIDSSTLQCETPNVSLLTQMFEDATINEPALLNEAKEIENMKQNTSTGALKRVLSSIPFQADKQQEITESKIKSPMNDNESAVGSVASQGWGWFVPLSGVSLSLASSSILNSVKNTAMPFIKNQLTGAKGGQTEGVTTIGDETPRKEIPDLVNDTSENVDSNTNHTVFRFETEEGDDLMFSFET